MDEREIRLKSENARTFKEQARGVAEAEERMQQELRAESTRMNTFKEEIAALVRENRDAGAAGPADGTGINYAAEVIIKTSIEDMKREMEEVKLHQKSLQDKYKEYLRIQDYNESREEMDRDLNDLKEMRNEFENSEQLLKELNDDKKAAELTQKDVKKAMEKIDMVEKRRREDLHKCSGLLHGLNDEVNAMQKTKEDCRMLGEQVEKMKEEMGEFHETMEAATMEVSSHGDLIEANVTTSLRKTISENCKKELEQQEEVLSNIFSQLQEHVYDLYQKVGSMSGIPSECEKLKQQMEEIPKWGEGVVGAIRTLEGLHPRMEGLHT